MLVYFCYLLGLKTKAAQVIGEKGNERKLESFGGNINVYKGSVIVLGEMGSRLSQGKQGAFGPKFNVMSELETG